MEEAKMKDISDTTNDVLAGKQDADCAKTQLHIKYCENCRKRLIENGEQLNR